MTAITLGIVGPGRAGTALAAYMRRNPKVRIIGCALGSATHQQRFLELIPEARIVSSAHELYTMCNTVIIAVADGALQEVCDAMVATADDAASLNELPTLSTPNSHDDELLKVVLHLSGAAPAQVLASAQAQGAAIGALHPIQAISSIATESLDAATRTFTPVTFTLQGDQSAQERAQALLAPLGNPVLSIDEHSKALYHAATSVAANLSMALFQSAVVMFQECGFSETQAREALAPLIITNAHSWSERGMQALTGPVSRADWGTVRKHKEAIAQCIEQCIAQFGNSDATCTQHDHHDADVCAQHDTSDYTARRERIITRLNAIYALLTEQLTDLYRSDLH